MSPENKAKFRIKAPESIPISPKDEDIHEEKPPAKPVFKAKETGYRDKLATMRPENDEEGRAAETKKFLFNVKDPAISVDKEKKPDEKKGFLSKFSKLKKKSESRKKKFSITSEKESTVTSADSASAKKFKMLDRSKSTLSDAPPSIIKEKVSFKNKTEQIRASKTEIIKEKVSFKKKKPVQAEKEQISKETPTFKKKEHVQIDEAPELKEKITFKPKEPPLAEKTQISKKKQTFKKKEEERLEDIPERKEKIAFKQKDLKSVEKDLPSKEKTNVYPKEEPLEEDIDFNSRIDKTDGSDSAKKKHSFKENKTEKALLRKKFLSASSRVRPKSGGLFSSNILNGVVLCFFSIVATYVLTTFKNSPDNSIMWKICFVPQIFLVYVVILVILYITSIALVLTGINTKFKGL